MQVSARTGFMSIKGVGKTFGAFHALHSINLDVREGEFLCLLGPSGCGKSTLLRIIAGLEEPSQGRLFLEGKDITALSPGARNFGILFQSYALFPNMSVAKNIGYGLAARHARTRTVAERVAALLDLIGLAGIENKYPSQLSGGQQQRVALARALAPEPILLLLDEPLSALDAKVRSRLRTELRLLQTQLGVTTIMVTHDQEEALTLADRVVVMNNGGIEQIGTPEVIYNEPDTLFVAQFVGAMNEFSGFAEEGGNVRLGSQLLQGIQPPGARVHERLKICIRPEHIVVNPAVGTADVTFDATVRMTEFLGAFRRLHLTVPELSGGPVVVDQSVSALQAMSAGASLRIGLPARHIRGYANAAADQIERP